ncbi:MAG TPA: zinc metalloprotease HtpX [Geminicoccaceae bacterium]|nr:zinc metalloprotease HtpX [Geminicoccaceae bacterium]
MLLVLGILARSLFGAEGAAWVLVFALVALMATPRLAPEWIMQLYRARPLRPYELPEVSRVLTVLAERAGLRRPPVLYYLPSPVLNAFAVGTREQAAIGVSDGLLRTLSLRELAGVLAHEVSHVRNNDLWLMGLADLMSRVTSVMSWLGQILLFLNLPLLLADQQPFPWTLVLLLIFSPTLMSLLQLALSRAREYDADLEGAGLTGDPRGLASALAKLERRQGRFWEEIFLPGRRIPDPSLLRTHPPTAARIRRLLQLEDAADEPAAGRPRLSAGPAVSGWMGAMPRGPRWHWPGAWY